MPQVHELTQAAYDRLKAEYDDLTTRWRIEIARKIEAARELGDLSENGDYHAAKEEQGKTEGRIAHLGAIIENHVIVQAGSTDQVSVGSIVEIRYDGDDDTETYLVGSIEDRGTDHEVVSPGSPLGAALVGSKPGETVSFESPGGKLDVEIVSIK